MNQEKENQILSKFLLLGTTNDLDQLSFNKVHITMVHYRQNYIGKVLATKINTQTNTEFG